MIKSMTGFGRCEIADEKYKITVEMKSVNHRYLEVGIKMPKKLNFFDAGIRNLLKKYVQRGKVDIFITYEDFNENKLNLKYNPELAKEYVEILKQISEQFDLVNDMKSYTIAKMPEVIVAEEATLDDTELWEALSKAIEGACEQFVDTRITEGENLKNDLVEKLDNMLTNVSFIEERGPQIIGEYRERLENKVKELLDFR